jgi:hypothetical protein
MAVSSRRTARGAQEEPAGEQKGVVEGSWEADWSDCGARDGRHILVPPESHGSSVLIIGFDSSMSRALLLDSQGDTIEAGAVFQLRRSACKGPQVALRAGTIYILPAPTGSGGKTSTSETSEDFGVASGIFRHTTLPSEHNINVSHRRGGASD